jgi:DNA-binding transcriptional LysR family regulator
MLATNHFREGTIMRSWEGLEEVVAIADAGTFVAAAALLGVSTSHISRVVARLEERLGATLFHRTTRRITPTATGLAFIAQSRRIVEERDELLSLANGEGEPHGELRLTCPAAIGEHFIAPIVRRFADDHPRLQVTLDLTNRIVDLIAEGYDCAIRTGQVSDARFTGREIGSRTVVTCASPAYLARAGTPQRVSDLKQHQCLVGTTATWHFLEDGKPRIFSPRGRWRCNSGAVNVTAAIAGMGICHVPTFYARAALDQGALVPVLDAYRANAEPIWAVYPHRRHLLPKVRDLVDLLASEMQPAFDD